MSYQKAQDILPIELLDIIQNYVDGECIYIPRKSGNKKDWGANTAIRKEFETRNRKIYNDYQNGYQLEYLSQKYYLSLKSIQRIILNEKRRHD
jgi:Mor family transcriptional regulator